MTMAEAKLLVLDSLKLLDYFARFSGAGTVKPEIRKAFQMVLAAAKEK
jgi:hypothetical protein